MTPPANDLFGLSLLPAHRPLIIGHRGCARRAPENTIPSFRLAFAAGAGLVELDFRESKDGQLVVIHDRDLDRTTDARRRWGGRRIRLASKTAAEIQGLDAGSWFGKPFAGTRVPLLGEALDAIHPQAIPVLERKAGEPPTLLSLLRRKRLLRKVVLLSFDWSFLQQVHRAEPTILLGALGPPTVLPEGSKALGTFKNFGTQCLKFLRATGAQIVVWNTRLSKRAIGFAHAHKLQVWVYTVNDHQLSQRLVRDRVDGIITDDPLSIQKGRFFFRSPPRFDKA